MANHKTEAKTDLIAMAMIQVYRAELGFQTAHEPREFYAMRDALCHALAHHWKTIMEVVDGQPVDMLERMNVRPRDPAQLFADRYTGKEPEIEGMQGGYFTSGPDIQDGDSVVIAAGFGVCADADFAEVGQPVIRIDRMPKTWRDMNALIELIVQTRAHVIHGPEAKAELAARRSHHG